MELGPTPAPELLTAATPQSRGPPESVRRPGRDPGAGSAAAPFELLLRLLGNRLPDGLPGGQTLPLVGSTWPPADLLTSDADAPAAPLDGSGAGASALVFAVPALLPPPPGAAGIAETPTALADALRLAFAGAPRTRAAPPLAASSALDTAIATATATAAAGTGTDAPAVAPPTPPGERAGARNEMPADLDALLALDPSARGSAQPAAEAFALRPNLSAEGRSRAPSGTPAERALSLATALARADASMQPRTDAAMPRAFDLQASAAASAPALLKAARLGEPVGVELTALGASADSPTALATLASPGSSSTAGTTAAPPNGQLPAHLGAPVDANSARWHEALASRIHWLVDHAVGEARIKLNPPELGALDVKISMLDDKTYVQMTAHTAAARDELAQSLPRLRDLMSASGLDLGGATVSGGRDDRSGYPSASQPVASALPFAPDSADLVADLPRARLHSASRIDLFA